MAIEFGGKKVSGTLSGLFDGMGMIGATLSGVVGLFLLDEKNPLKGWNIIFLIQFSCSILVLVATILFTLISYFSMKKSKSIETSTNENSNIEIQDDIKEEDEITSTIEKDKEEQNIDKSEVENVNVDNFEESDEELSRVREILSNLEESNEGMTQIQQNQSNLETNVVSDQIKEISQNSLEITDEFQTI